MERDPVRLAWRSGRAGHLLVFGLLVLALPLAFVTIDLPRMMVADALPGAARVPFLQIAYDWPPFVRRPERIVLFEGFPLSRTGLLVAALSWIALVFVLRAFAHVLIDRWRLRSADRALRDISARLARRLTQARTIQGLDLTEAMGRAAADLAAVRNALAQALTLPAFAGARMALAIAYAAWLDLRLGLAVALIALALILLSHWRRRSVAGSTRETAARAVRIGKAKTELVRRWKAVRAHGAQEAELAAFAARLTAPSPETDRGDAIRRLRDAFADLAPFAAPALAGLIAVGGGLGVPDAVGALVATALLPAPARGIARWREDRALAGERLTRVSELMGALRARREPDGATAPKSPEGVVILDGLVAADQVAGLRVGPVSLEAPAPVHVALMAPGDQEAELLAATLAGLSVPATGSAAIAGIDPGAVPAKVRARRIAFTSAEPVLSPGATWIENLAYGLSPEARNALLDSDIAAVLRAVGLERIIDARALGAPVDPRQHPALAEAVLPARQAVHERLGSAGLGDLVERFRPDAYNPYATIAENILFGVPVGDTFDAGHLASHPFFRAVMEAEGLAPVLAEMGLSIATTVTDMFADIPAGHPLFGRLSFMAADEREIYEALVARRARSRRGEGATRDRDRLIALALRYIETRHRLGLVDEAMEARLLRARRTFAQLLPPALKPAIDFYDPGSLCRAATLADNLLFGRIAYDMAGAEAKVGAAVRGVIADMNLERDVVRLGLSTRIEGPDGIRPDLAVAVDLARALLRRPEALIASRPDFGLDGPQGAHRIASLREALSGRTFIAIFSGEEPPPGFDQVIRLDAQAASRG